MTTLGLQWLQHQETQRSNLAREAETHRSNLENERLKSEATAATVSTADKDRSSREMISSLDRSSRELIAYADRVSKEGIASADRSSRLDIAAADREARVNIADLDREANYVLTELRNASSERIAYRSQDVQKAIAGANNLVSRYLGELNALSREEIARLDREQQAELKQAELALKEYETNLRYTTDTIRSSLTADSLGVNALESQSFGDWIADFLNETASGLENFTKLFGNIFGRININ